MGVEIDKVKRTRSTYRGNITKLVTKISDLLASGSEECDKGKLRYHQSDLYNKLNKLRAAEKVILDNLIANAEQDVVNKEMDEIDQYKEKTSTIFLRLKKLLEDVRSKSHLTPPPSMQMCSGSEMSRSASREYGITFLASSDISTYD